MRRVRRSARCVLFVVGPPGAGKTTLVREVLGYPDTYVIMKPKWTISNDRNRTVCAAGHYTGAVFDGADQVPYNGAAAALDYWKRYLSETAKLTIFDGDRFSNAGVVEQLKAMPGFVVKCLHLTVPNELLVQRREERGSNQNAKWLKGRVTKAENFAALFTGGDVLYLCSDAAVGQLAKGVQAFVTPHHEPNTP